MASTDSINVCHLMDLAPEVRCIMYDYLYQPSETKSTRINLLHASPPTDTSMLSTCKQLYNEASPVYESAYRSYWRNNVFVLQLQCPVETGVKELYQQINNLKFDPRGLRYIQNIEIVGLDIMELTATRERITLKRGTSKAGLVKLVRDYAQRYQKLLDQQWYDEFFSTGS